MGFKGIFMAFIIFFSLFLGHARTNQDIDNENDNQNT